VTPRNAASGAPRLRVSCDSCGAGAWLGPRPDGSADAWCEACQRGFVLAAGAPPACPECGGRATLEGLRSEELYGEIQHALAVVRAWRGDPAMLATLLPDRAEFLSDLDPPAGSPGDGAALAAALRWLYRGRFTAARAGLGEVPAGERDQRFWLASAVAGERLGDPTAAEAAWTRVLDHGEQERARLARGALRARRGDWSGARQDFA